jgi:hypothetical protein
MLADGIVAAGPVGYVITVGVPIIPEVIEVGKDLIFVIEIDLIEPAIEAAPPPPPPQMQMVKYGNDRVKYGNDLVVY